MSPEVSPRLLKRDHDAFESYSQYPSQLPDLDQPFSVPPEYLVTIETERQNEEASTNELPSPLRVGMKRAASPARSSTGDLTDAGPDTPSRGTTPVAGAMPSNAAPQSSAFATLNGSAPPPAKKAKLTFQEKEMRRINKEIKDKERAEEKARKDAERQAQAEERARKEAEKEAERKKKDAERQAQAEEKARKDAEKDAEKKRKEVEREEKRVALEAEKAAKEERRKKKEEEKLKKDKGQMKLNNFFAMPAQPRNRSGSVESRGRSSMSPAPQSSLASMLTASAPSPSKHTPSKPQLSAYEKLFPDFFIQNGVTLAPTNRFERDAEASEAIQTTIDSYILGNRSPGRQRPFDATSLFHISPNVVPRGQRRMPVREIMTEFYSGNASKPIDLTTDSQNSQIKRTTDLLQKIPMKFLQFKEDVRPPYRGTYTARPVTGMTKLARNPLRRDLPDTNYDYDSEAEWIEDEDAEDLKSEGDEEEDLDDGEDMEGFLDDDGDETSNSKRLVLQGDLEPISTGLCWEDRTKRNTNVKMVAYRMEIILDSSIKSIDPFSTSYWETQASSMDPPRIPLNSMRNTSLNFNGQAVTKSAKSFFSPASDVLKSSTSSPQIPAGQLQTTKGKDKDSKPKELLPPDKIEAFKQEVQAGNELSKVGLVEVLKLKFRGHTAGTIKATLDAVAKKGPGKHSVWVLRDDSEVAAQMS